MRSLGRRSLLLVVLCLAPALALAQAPRRVPVAGLDPRTGEKVVVIPEDWREHFPFAARFSAVQPGTPGRRVIDLAATRFTTDDLAGDPRGGRRFLAPGLSAFPSELVREPFAAGQRDELFILQARSPVDQRALHDALALEGVAVLGYVPEDAYLVRLDAAGLARLARHPAVFWAGLFQPAWKIAPKLDFVIEAHADLRLKLQALFDAASYPTRESVVAALAGSGLTPLVVERRDADWKVRLAARAAAARDLAALPGALFVERFTDFETQNNVARTSVDTPTARGAADGPIMDVEDVWDRGIRGEGQISAAADTGLSTGNFATLHHDFGQLGSATNPLRLLTAYALGRPPSDWSDNQSFGGGHGTHVSGSILGNGVRSGADPSTNTFPSTSYAGTAPQAEYVFQSIMNSIGQLTGIPPNLNNLFQPPYNDGARVHSNSWGSNVFGQYTADSQEVDEFAWNHKDMVITFAAGNSGEDGRRVVSPSCVLTGDPIDGVIDDDSIGSPATAKNCITVGATENYRPDFIYEFPQGDCTSTTATQRTWGWFNSCAFSTNPVFGDLMANNASGLGAFSSRGPTDDLRIKPDVAAPGIAIISTRTDLNQAYQQWGTCNVPGPLQTFYLTLGGTSMATPLTAGAATLVRQYYVDGWHPNGTFTTYAAPVATDGFSPSSALVKATLINGAWDMTPGQYGVGGTQEIPPNWDGTHDFPNQAEGFGRVDVEGSLFTGAGFGHHPSRDLEVHDVATGLQTGQFLDFPFTIATSADELKVTLVWTDPRATAGAGIKLVNDLDLTVSAPGGAVFFPNAVDSLAGADHRNNVESATITAPAAGDWMARVAAFNVPGNGVAGTNIQDYALVLSGVLNLCGNNAIEPPEICDGTDLDGQTCIDHGFDAGVLACSANCAAFDLSGCLTCDEGLTQGRWNLPSGLTPGAVHGILFHPTGTTVIYTFTGTLTATGPGTGTITGTLSDGTAPDPDFDVQGSWTITVLPGSGQWSAAIFLPGTSTQVGKMGGRFRDDPNPAVSGSFSGEWKVCQ